MNKNDVKNLLMSMRNSENASIINNILGKISEIPDEKLQVMIEQIGDNEESIRKYIEGKIQEKTNNQEKEEHTPINDMFTYGTTGNCIHLHMPVDLHSMITEKGLTRTFETVDVFLLDAIEKIRNLQNNGYYKFKGKDSIYMISPILIGKSMKFLEEMDFETHFYKKRELKDEEFVLANKEAMLAVNIFGKDKNVGTARIGLDVINSKEWQNKRKAKVEEFREKGIVLEEIGIFK